MSPTPMEQLHTGLLLLILSAVYTQRAYVVLAHRGVLYNLGCALYYLGATVLRDLT